MHQREAVFCHSRGLHIRAAAMMVYKALEIEHTYGSKIYIHNRHGKEVPASALMALHSLNLAAGEKMTIVAKGGKALEAVDCFEQLLKSGFLLKDDQDIEGVDGILEDVSTITHRAVKYLLGYDWPGNVRELENVLERALNLTDDNIIDVEDLPTYITGISMEDQQFLVNLGADGEIAPLEEYEKEIIKFALKKYRSFNAAGKALGITHKTVASKARKFGLAAL